MSFEGSAGKVNSLGGGATFIDVEIDADESQMRVITEGIPENSVLDIASGPGTGKTRTLCQRVAYLISQGIAPSEIAVISYANVNVDDLRRTLNELISETLTAQIHISTINSLAQTITQNNSSYWRIIRDIKVLPNAFITNVFKHLTIGGNGSSEAKSQLKKLRISQLSQLRSTDLQTYIKYLGFDYGGDLTDISDLSLIYDKSVLEATKILKSHNSGFSKFSIPPFISNLKEIIVDEYQDTKKLSIDFILELARNKHLTVSGDENQMIYNFSQDKTTEHNADWNRYNINVPSYIKHVYMQSGRGYKSINLDKTYRFNNNIKTFATEVSTLKSHIKHSLDETEIPVVEQTFPEIKDQYRFVFNEVHELIGKSNGLVTPKNIAIIGFANAHIDGLREFFENRQSKYHVKKLKAETKYVDSKVSVLFTILRVMDDPHDNSSMLVIMNLFKGIGNRTAFNLFEEAAKNQTSLYEVLKSKPKFQELLQEFNGILTELDRNDAASIVKTLIRVSNLLQLKKKLTDDKFSTKLPVILEDIYKSCQLALEEKSSSITVLKHLIDNYEDEIFQSVRFNEGVDTNTDDSITISTIHSSKGFEWDIVFILSNMSELNLKTYEIDNKLKYVSLTRARHLLYYNRNIDEKIKPLDQVYTTDVGVSQGNARILESLKVNMKRRKMLSPNLLRSSVSNMIKVCRAL